MKTLGMILGFAIVMFAATDARAQQQKIGMKKAKAIATARVAGKIKSAELEEEHGKWVYSFDIRSSDGKIMEVQVDAYAGSVLSVEEESEEREAAEKKEEKAEKTAKKKN